MRRPPSACNEVERKGLSSQGGAHQSIGHGLGVENTVYHNLKPSVKGGECRTVDNCQGCGMNGK